MITRREFGQWLVGTFVLVGNNLLPLGCGRRQEELLADVTWKKGVCRFCGTGCGVLVGVRDGKVVALQGDRRYAEIRTPHPERVDCQQCHVEQGTPVAVARSS